MVTWSVSGRTLTSRRVITERAVADGPPYQAKGRSDNMRSSLSYDGCQIGLLVHGEVYLSGRARTFIEYDDDDLDALIESFRE